MYRRSHRKTAASLAAAAFLSACASPEIDRSAAGFDEEPYSLALSECRGGSVVAFMFDGFVGALAGSMIGAAEGSTCCIYGGDSAEAIRLAKSVAEGNVGNNVGSKAQKLLSKWIGGEDG